MSYIARLLTIPQPKNGAHLVSAVRVSLGYLVLCMFRDEWVSWLMSDDGECYWGRYSTNGADAAVAFEARCREYGVNA